MSGIVGMVHFDGRPVDPGLVLELTASLRFRGPDASRMWSDGCVGLGHALFATTPELRHACQPCSFDSDVWIVADARIDARAELIGRLKNLGRSVLHDCCDAELILHAYHAWGEECVDRLLGDFSFAIWDGRRKRLFAARDAMGVKPFYYSRRGDSLAFGNTLNTLHLHPQVDSTLNDLAVADFLLFGYNLDLGRTTFRDIDRLPPGHAVVFQKGSTRTRRFWSVPNPPMLRYRRSDEYVEQFRSLLETAVSDRLRLDTVGVFMSGGLDSTSLAAVARGILPGDETDPRVRAYIVAYRSLFNDPEERFAGIAAQHLGIPLHVMAADRYRLFERWDTGDLMTPEPYMHPQAAATLDLERQAAAHSRVVLNGEDPDTLLHPARSVRAMLRAMPWWQVVRDVVQYRLEYGQRKRFGFGVLRRLQGRRPPVPWRPHYPEWLDEEISSRFSLQERWDAHMQEDEAGPLHPRPDACGLLHPRWQLFLESQDIGVRQVPLEVRFPFIDLRLIEFCLALPPLPWCEDKHLLRAAMKDRLPDAVRLRPKTVLQGDPPHAKLAEPASAWIDTWTPRSELAAYVRHDRIPALARCGANSDGGMSPAVSWVHLRPWLLNQWLGHVNPSQPNPVGGSMREKKQYHTPVLVQRGDVASLTQTVYGGGIADGGSAPNRSECYPPGTAPGGPDYECRS